MLAYLMETSGRAAKDLLAVFGTRGRVSEIVNGKRSIGKEQAKKLASLFNLSRPVHLISAPLIRASVSWK
jgi:antitoxin component HigA of HigAB toxin-antitoxin module